MSRERRQREKGRGNENSVTLLGSYNKNFPCLGGSNNLFFFFFNFEGRRSYSELRCLHTDSLSPFMNNAEE